MRIGHTKAAVALGALSGMRTLSATAVFSHYLRYNNLNIKDRKIKFLGSTGFAILSKILAAGEVAADKSSKIPDRVRPGGLSGRALSGALVGAAVYSLNRHQVWKGALVGAASALVSTVLSFYGRKFINQKTKLPDHTIGAVEDMVAVGGSIAVLEGVRQD